MEPLVAVALVNVPIEEVIVRADGTSLYERRSVFRMIEKPAVAHHGVIHVRKVEAAIEVLDDAAGYLDPMHLVGAEAMVNVRDWIEA
jgi:hypothetical protein